MAPPKRAPGPGRPPLRTTPKGLSYAQGRPHGVYKRSATISARPGEGVRGPAGRSPAPKRRSSPAAAATPAGRARRAAGAPLAGAQRVTGAGHRIGRYSARGLLTAELLAGAGIVAIRAVADYEPQADGTLKGKIGHPKGQYGPLPILAGLIGTFFLLSFLAARGGTRGKVAVIAGGLIDVVLAMKSLDEMTTVSTTFARFGKAKVPAGDWQTSGTQAGTPIEGSGGSSGSGSSGKGKKGSGDIPGTKIPDTPLGGQPVKSM